MAEFKAGDVVKYGTGFISIPKSKWTQYVNLWDDGTDPGHEYKDLTSVNIVDAEDPDSGNFYDMGFATFKNGDALIFNSNGSKTVHDVSAYEAMRMIESGESINADEPADAEVVDRYGDGTSMDDVWWYKANKNYVD